MRIIAALLVLPLTAFCQPAPPVDTALPPQVQREFRALWVATVNNMDWPSRPDLTTAQQQRELLAILDRAAALKMNAIVFQVRPEADALYVSELEPWSRYLTGQQGRPPSPLWDPLEFAVTESRKRGMELHAWFNPYRLAFWRERERSPQHITSRRPDLVRTYAQYLWLDPGLRESRLLMMRAVLDVVRRYDVDGVHIDDYFYPYPEISSATGRVIEFPDAPTFQTYQRNGGTLSRADWRRNNVDELVQEFYQAVKAEKPWVKVGISPFGIWRPGVPATTTAGLDQHNELYADVRKWLHEGWLDYLAPQLYWPVRPADQSYPVLLRWWVEENLKGRHIWPGLALYKLPLTGPRRMTADDIVEEIGITRETAGATGHIHFNARVLMNNVQGIGDRLTAIYDEPALVPASPWLDSIAPAGPNVRVTDSTGSQVVRFEAQPGDSVWQWVVQARVAGAWHTTVLPRSRESLILQGPHAAADAVAVTAVDRTGNASAATVVPRPR